MLVSWISKAILERSIARNIHLSFSISFCGFHAFPLDNCFLLWFLVKVSGPFCLQDTCSEFHFYNQTSDKKWKWILWFRAIPWFRVGKWSLAIMESGILKARWKDVCFFIFFCQVFWWFFNRRAHLVTKIWKIITYYKNFEKISKSMFDLP